MKTEDVEKLKKIYLDVKLQYHMLRGNVKSPRVRRSYIQGCYYGRMLELERVLRMLGETKVLGQRVGQQELPLKGN